MIRVELLADRVDAWDRLVARDDTGAATFCHLAGWRALMSDVLGHEAPYLVAADPSGAWRGALPLVRVRSRLFGDYLVSLPFLNSGGPVGDPEAAEALTLHALSLAQRLGVDLLELRARQPLPGAEGGGLRVSPRKITGLLPLGLSADQLWGLFPSKLRSQIRRAEREGFEPRFGADQVEPFYAVFSRHMRDLGAPVMPRRWFEAIAENFMIRSGRPLAAMASSSWMYGKSTRSSLSMCCCIPMRTCSNVDATSTSSGCRSP